MLGDEFDNEEQVPLNQGGQAVLLKQEVSAKLGQALPRFLGIAVMSAKGCH